MSRIYAPYNISFNLRDVTRTKNADWSNLQDGKKMTSNLRQGDFASLNMYFLSGFFDVTGTLGRTYNSFKFDGDEESDIFYRDGTVIDINTMPGGKQYGPKDKYENVNNLGRGTVHEVGHWLGLNHVFANQTLEPCSADDKGDGVDDTPQQFEPTYKGCSVRDRHDNFCSIKPKAHHMYSHTRLLYLRVGLLTLSLRIDLQNIMDYNLDEW